MVLMLQRVDPCGALYGATMYIYPKSLGKSINSSKVLVAIPNETHLAIPLGYEGPELQVDYISMHAATFQELRKWDCNWHVKAIVSTLSYDIPQDSYWLLTGIDTKRGKAYVNRWDIKFTLKRQWNFEGDIQASTPWEPTEPTLRTDGIVGVELTDISTAEAINFPCYSISYSHKGSDVSVAIPDENPLLCPLGTQGPKIQIEAIIDGTKAEVVRDWNTNTILRCTKTSYLEFDLEDLAAPTYYSRWIVDGVSLKRSGPVAAASAVSDQKWDVTVNLIRYHRWAELTGA